MTSDAATDTSARPQTPAIELYDFRRPTTLAREHSRVLEVVFETFSRQWGTQLTARVRVKSHVVSGSVLMQTYDEYAASLPPTTAMVLCSLEGSDSKAVFQFPMSSALSWIGRMLGGNGLQAAPDRKFSQIEQSLVKQLMNDALEDLRYSLGSRFSIPIAIDSIQYNSQFAQAAATSDLMIVANFVITVGEDVAAATLAIPSEVLLEQMGAANPTDSIENAAELMQEQLLNVPVEVALELTPTLVKPRTILNLAVGDVLKLPHQSSQPFNLTVAGHHLATAAAGSNGSRIAAVIVSTEEKNR